MLSLSALVYLIASTFYNAAIAYQHERIYFSGFEEPLDWSEDVGSFDPNVHTFEPIVWYRWNNDYQRCPSYKDGDASPSAAYCVRVYKDAFITRIISTIGYHSIRLQIDVNARGVEAAGGDWCIIQYRTATTNWVNVNIIQGNDVHILNFDIAIPDNEIYNNQSSFEVKVGVDADTGGDSCFFDNLEVFGVSYPTANPTQYTSVNPTRNPTVKMVKSTTLESTLIGNNTRKESDGDGWITAIIVVTMVIVCLCVVLLAWIGRLGRNKSDEIIPSYVINAKKANVKAVVPVSNSIHVEAPAELPSEIAFIGDDKPDNVSHLIVKNEEDSDSVPVTDEGT